MTERLLKVEGVKKYYGSGGLGDLVRRKEKIVRAVDGVSFEITKGENFGLVGESGCGKSTLCRLIVTLTKPTEGKIMFEGKDIYSYEGGEREYFRKVQMVFQASAAALNPRQRIGSQISQSVKFLAMTKNRQESDALVRKALEEVGLSPAEKFIGRYPHELSGGQKQRVCIARAMISNPRLVVADEPVSSLDVSLKGQILSLMRDLQSRIGTTYLFVSHEIAIVANICDWIAVMYKGRIVELARTKELLRNPLHPYTQLLLASYPDYSEHGRTSASSPTTATDQVASIPSSGRIPHIISASTPDGCRFRDRCPSVMTSCAMEEPPLIAVGNDHFAACLLYD